jgi:hypothetical protein
MASPSGPSQTSALKSTSGADLDMASLDIAPEMEALRAKRRELYGEKLFDTEKYNRLVAERSPARLPGMSELEFSTALSNAFVQFMEAGKVSHADDIETYFAGKAALIGLSKNCLDDSVHLDKVQADIRAAGQAVADQITIYEQKREIKALRDQAKALEDQVRALKDQAKARKDLVKAQEDEIKALQEQVALFNAR